VWQEQPNKNNQSDQKSHTSRKVPSAAEISEVEQGSIGEDLGFEPGDSLLTINGKKPRDLIDYNIMICEENLILEILDKTGKTHIIEIEKEQDSNLGINFKDAIFDTLKQCNNQCPFCFIDQQPPGKRHTLYIKDDDYRLSFLYGSYLTLTNLNAQDWERIERQKLSPLYISVHATDTQIRRKLLNNKKAKSLLKQIKWFNERSLQLHAQVVVCPTINDKGILEKTLLDLSKYAKGDWPTVISVAIVPVGLTKFRPKNDGLIPVDKEFARDLIKQVEKLQRKFLLEVGTRFVWLSDEWYLIGGLKLPDRKSYEELPQEANGVGSIRDFLKQLSIASQQLPKRIKTKKNISWVVGKLVKEALDPICATINKVEGINLKLYGLPSKYWGQDQIVTGLLTGQDLIEGLNNIELGDQLLVPSIMLKLNTDVFLDDLSINDVEKKLSTPIRVVSDSNDMIKAILETNNIKSLNIK
tara:strand:+ start:6106 stop:7515 length:1410 start_codon:yes stop_codon:yes gene_type:complete